MTAEHWDDRYASTPESDLTWAEQEPDTSLALIGSVAGPEASVVDVGGGTSRLVDRLLERGHRDLTVVDISQEALASSLERVGAAPVDWLAVDVREWQPARTFDVWHDRAAYHFLVDPDEQQTYWDLVRASVPHGGNVIVGTFADDGPESCSGLPVVRYGERELVDAAGEGFSVVKTLRQEHTTPSGVTQSFVWLVAERT